MHDRHRTARRLQRLPAFRIADGEPDIRGWITVAHDGYRIGRVHDVILDLATGQVRHLEIRLDRDVAGRAQTDRLVIPIAALEVSASRRQVHLRGVRRDELVDAPQFGAAPIGEREERWLRRFYRCDRIAGDAARFWGVRRRGRERSPYARVPLA